MKIIPTKEQLGDTLQIKINQPTLSALVQTVARAASLKDTLPALAGMMLEAKDGILTAQATDLEIGIIAITYPHGLCGDGKALVNAQYFANLVKNIPEGEVEISLNGEKNQLTVKYGKSKANVTLLDHEEYINWPINEATTLFTCENQQLRDALANTVIACAKNHFKPVFNGVLLDINENTVDVVASDTHRLAAYQFPIEGGKPAQKIIPYRAVREIIRLVSEPGKVTVATTGNSIVVNNGNTTLTCIEIEGQYPNWRGIIPTNFALEAKVQRESLLDSLKRLSVIPVDANKIPVTRLGFAQERQFNTQGTLTLSGKSDKTGEIQEVVDVELVIGGTTQTTVNTNYLREFVQTAKGQEVLVYMQESNTLPLLLKDASVDGYKYVLVPLRTG